MQREIDVCGHALPETLKMLEKAAALGGGGEGIERELERCRRHQIDRNFYGKLQHTVLPLPVFPKSRSADYFSAMLDSAFVMKAAIPATALEFLTPEYLVNNYGDTMVEYASPGSGFQFDVTGCAHSSMPMREALALLEANARAYVMWNLRYRERAELVQRIGLLDKIPIDEFWLDSVLATDALRDEVLRKTHWYQMMIGSRDSGMFNHYDVFENSGWHLHVRGSKRWHVCHPDNGRYMKKYTKFGIGETNCFNPNYESHPEFRKVVGYLGELTAGDILYYPGQFWHQTHNVQDLNITFTCSAVHARNFRRVIACMKSCCVSGMPYRFSGELCRALPDVYAHWEEQYGAQTRGQS